MGDSRCVIRDNGEVIDLSNDHKPDVPSEKERILNSGHMVIKGRVDGSIAVCRAIGDWEFKDIDKNESQASLFAVSPIPEVIVHPISPGIDYLISACDGIWDCMTS